MGTLVVVALVVVAALTAVVLALPHLLARRGVTMCRTRFGLTLVFDAANEDGTPVRLLNVNGTYQSVSYVPEDLRFELACEYHRAMADVIWGLAVARRREARASAGAAGARGTGAGPEAGCAPAPAPVPDVLRVMVMGGGGYSLPKYLAAFVPNAVCDAVEVDPAMTALAREHFFLDECLEQTEGGRAGRLRLVEGDAWDVLRAATEPYDVIVNDAFSGKRPLGPMRTSEGAAVVRAHLAPGGAYLANVRCAQLGRGSGPLREVEEAFGREFAHVWYVPEWPDDPKKPGNNALVATDADLPLPDGAVVVR